MREKLSWYWLRLRRGVENYGPWGLLRLAITRIFRDEEYAWFALDLSRLKPMRFRGEGYELHRGTEQDAEMLREVPAIPVGEGRRRIARGEQLWFVLQRGEPAFTCSAFVNELPLEYAPAGRYVLPDRVASIDDGWTKREHRGRAIAAAAWIAIAERLRDDDGVEVVIARAPIDNIASRRTHEKSGFAPTMFMRVRGRGFLTRVTFRDAHDGLTTVERKAADDVKRALSR